MSILFLCLAQLTSEEDIVGEYSFFWMPCSIPRQLLQNITTAKSAKNVNICELWLLKTKLVGDSYEAVHKKNSMFAPLVLYTFVLFH